MRLRPPDLAPPVDDDRPAASRRRRTVRLLTVAVAAAALLSGVAAPGLAATPVPPTPAPFPAAIEALQPYVGQAVCDPVAKPGVRAFSRLLMNTYPDTGSLGIVRDCGIGGRSEHKEGRAFDWAVSANNASHVAEVQAVLTWLLATDRNGHRYARARRLGIMYIIWNRKIWKAYDPGTGWAAYTGASPHTDHVHFSFGWNGSRRTTSWYDGTVARIDYGPGGAPSTPTPTPTPAPVPVPTVVPVRTPANLPVLARYGDVTLSRGDSGGAVRTMQSALKITADGSYGPRTEAAVAAFQRSRGVTATGTFAPADWRRLFPAPQSPFGGMEAVPPTIGDPVVAGWALDADTDDPVRVHLWVDGKFRLETSADRSRPDIADLYTAYGSRRGFSVRLPLSEGRHEVCAYAINAAGTAGGNTKLGCRPVTVRHAAAGVIRSVAQVPGGVHVDGWALDPDTESSNEVHVYVDGRYVRAVPADRQIKGLAAYPLHGDRHGFRTTLQLATGTRKVCAWSLNAPGTKGQHTLLGCRTVVVRHAPTGAFEQAATPPGTTVRVSGWALDPDTTAAVSTQLYVDGRLVRAVPARGARSDVGSRYPAYGPGRGWSAALTLGEGRRKVCAYALNVAGTPGARSSLGCRTVTVRHTPQGSLQRVAQGPGGVTVAGWAIDDNTRAPILMHVYVDGRYTSQVRADVRRTDVGARFPAYGPTHGFSTRLRLGEGLRRVCVYALNAARTPGKNKSLGCRSVRVLHQPLGALDPLRASGRTVTVDGWALDPDAKGTVNVHLWVDGRYATATAANLANSRVARNLPEYGPRHGYRTALTLAPGNRRVCAYAINLAGTPGKNKALGCRRIVLS